MAMYKGTAWQAQATFSGGDTTKSFVFSPRKTEGEIAATNEAGQVSAGSGGGGNVPPTHWQVRAVNEADDGTMVIKIDARDEAGDDAEVISVSPLNVALSAGQEVVFESRNPSLVVTVTEGSGTLAAGDVLIKVKAWSESAYVDENADYDNTAVA